MIKLRSHDIQHNDIQYYHTQQNNKNVRLSITLVINMPIVQIVIMLGVVVLNVIIDSSGARP
jgi:hypothetical protein